MAIVGFPRTSHPFSILWSRFEESKSRIYFFHESGIKEVLQGTTITTTERHYRQGRQQQWGICNVFKINTTNYLNKNTEHLFHSHILWISPCHVKEMKETRLEDEKGAFQNPAIIMQKKQNLTVRYLCRCHLHLHVPSHVIGQTGHTNAYFMFLWRFYSYNIIFLLHNHLHNLLHHLVTSADNPLFSVFISRRQKKMMSALNSIKHAPKTFCRRFCQILIIYYYQKQQPA